jgi:hypothetical protein
MQIQGLRSRIIPFHSLGASASVSTRQALNNVNSNTSLCRDVGEAIELHPGFGNQSKIFLVCPAVRLMTSLAWTNKLRGYLTTKSRLIEIYEGSICK